MERSAFPPATGSFGHMAQLHKSQWAFAHKRAAHRTKEFNPPVTYCSGIFFSPEMSIWLLHSWKFAHCQMSSHVGAVSCSTPMDMANPWSLSSDRREEPIQGHWGFLLPVLRCPQCPGSVPVGNKRMNFIPIFMSRKFNYESMLWFSSWLWYLLFCFY